MTNSDDFSEAIIRYLDNEMTTEERGAFEKVLKENKELQKELELYRDINYVIAKEDTIDFKHQLNKAKQNHENNKVNNTSPRLIKLRIVALSGAAAAVAAIIIYLYSFNMDSDSLYEKYYSIPEMSMIIRSTDTGSVLFNEAIVQYQNENYVKAASMFAQIDSIENEAYAIKYYAGISNLASDAESIAISYFDEVIENGTNPFVSKALWFQGLAYLSLNDKESAKKVFTALYKRESHYKKQAKQILRRL